MKNVMNPPLKTGDRIILLHMEGESNVTPGTRGTVRKISSDPFEKNSEIIAVNWDNGSSLSLLSATDVWKIISEENLSEAVNIPQDYASFRRNKDIFENFDWRFIRDFLYKLRDTGIVNMFGAAPLIYSGSEHIDRYYGEGREDDEEFQEFLELADEAKQKFIINLIDYMNKKNMDVNDLDLVNSMARKISKQFLDIYISLS